MRRVLIANRGEIAVRIAETVQGYGMEAVAVYSDADADALHVAVCNSSVRLGPAEAAASYLDVSKLLAAAESSGADAIHPGYGFLSENADFAQAVVDAGLTWIGPPASAIEAMGDKARAKVLMREAGVPVLPGWEGTKPTADDATAVGFPLLIKAVAGGGGRGMRVVEATEEFEAALEAAQREASGAFGRGDVLLERYVTAARHVEVQVLGDGSRAVHVGERECSVQRRHQKVIEEAPSVAVDEELRSKLGAAAVAAAEAVGYVGAGTVEFLLEASGDFWFLEMNTRLQVEHRVTEAVFGINLVGWQLDLAAGKPLPDSFEGPDGWSIEARLYAEDPAAGYLPQSGPVLAWDPPRATVDTGVRAGDQVSPHYDPMIAKYYVWGPTREMARQRLVHRLKSSPVLGVTTNAAHLIEILEHPDYVSGAVDTGWLERELVPSAVESDPALAAAAAVLVSKPDGVPWNSRGVSEWPVFFEDELRVQHVDGHRYTVGGTEVELVGDRLRIGGVVRRYTAARDGRTLHLWVDGLGQGAFAEPDPLLREEPIIAGDGTIRAPMSGKVVRVDVEVGADVAHGDGLVVLEAMKMETPVRSDVDGAVTEVRVAVGDQVRQGDVLALIGVEAQ